MKKPNYLKGLRVVLAILIFVPILLFFVDFADVLPDNLHTLLHLQIMPAILGGMAGLVVFQFVLALLFGRIYCSVICPAGVLQDIINRVFCIGKKKWEVIDTINGAKTSAVIYSIAETAKANNLKPYEYFEHLLTVIPEHMEDTDRSFLEDLLPWSPKLPENIQK